MLQGWHIGVVIPARNEEEHVASVIEGLPSFVDIAVVVDDGSDDTTAVQAKNANTPCELVVLEGAAKELALLSTWATNTFWAHSVQCSSAWSWPRRSNESKRYGGVAGTHFQQPSRPCQRQSFATSGGLQSHATIPTASLKSPRIFHDIGRWTTHQ